MYIINPHLQLREGNVSKKALNKLNSSAVHDFAKGLVLLKPSVSKIIWACNTDLYKTHPQVFPERWLVVITSNALDRKFRAKKLEFNKEYNLRQIWNILGFKTTKPLWSAFYQALDRNSFKPVHNLKQALQKNHIAIKITSSNGVYPANDDGSFYRFDYNKGRFVSN